MSKVFGYPKFDENGEMVLTTYDNEYKAMMMDIRVYSMKTGQTRTFREKERRQLFFSSPENLHTHGKTRKRLSAEKMYLQKGHGHCM